MSKRDAVKFTFVISGDGEFEKKLADKLNGNPEMNHNIVYALGQVLMLAFNWTKNEHIAFDHFKAIRVEKNTEKQGESDQ